MSALINCHYLISIDVQMLRKVHVTFHVRYDFKIVEKDWFFLMINVGNKLRAQVSKLGK